MSRPEQDHHRENAEERDNHEDAVQMTGSLLADLAQVNLKQVAHTQQQRDRADDHAAAQHDIPYGGKEGTREEIPEQHDGAGEDGDDERGLDPHSNPNERTTARPTMAAMTSQRRMSCACRLAACARFTCK